MKFSALTRHHIDPPQKKEKQNKEDKNGPEKEAVTQEIVIGG